MRQHPRTLTVGLLSTLFALWVIPAVRAEDPVKYLGSDTEAIVSVNFRQIMDSKLADDYKIFVNQAKMAMEAMLQNNQELQKFQKDLNFDVFRDLHAVTVASSGGTDPESYLFIVDGKFDTNKFRAAGADALQKYPGMLKMHRQGRHEIYEVSGDEADKKAFVTLVNAETLLVGGAKESITKALTQGDQGGQGNLKPTVKGLLKTAGAKQSISMLSTSDAMIKGLQQGNVPNGQAAQAQLDKIVGMTASIKIGADIRFELGLEAKNEETAKEFTQQMAIGLFAVKGMIAQKANDDPKMALVQDIVQTLQVRPTDNTVVIDGRISPKVIENAIKEFGGGFNP